MICLEVLTMPKPTVMFNERSLVCFSLSSSHVLNLLQLLVLYMFEWSLCCGCIQKEMHWNELVHCEIKTRLKHSYGATQSLQIMAHLRLALVEWWAYFFMLLLIFNYVLTLGDLIRNRIERYVVSWLEILSVRNFLGGTHYQDQLFHFSQKNWFGSLLLYSYAFIPVISFYHT